MGVLAQMMDRSLSADVMIRVDGESLARQDEAP